jgi:hypothetical protein
MRYAIGEIVLVVIGILIALSINNWNEARKEKVKERKILIELENNLAANSKILSDEISNQKRIANQISVTIEHLENKKPFNDSIGKYVNQMQWPERTQFVSSAYESLKTSGIDIISNDSIRADVTFIFGNEFPYYTSWQKDIGAGHASWTQPLIMKYFKHGSFSKSNDPLQGYKIATDYQSLLQNQEFINVITSRKAFKEATVYKFEELLDRVENARARIKKELEMFD